MRLPESEMALYIRLFINLAPLLCFVVSEPQYGQYNRPLDPNNPYNPLNYPTPGDVNYRTYIYNSRRYGQYAPNYNPQVPNPGSPNYNYDNRRYPNYNPTHDPNYNPIDGTYRDPYDQSHTQIPLPGILGNWRSDLQGKKRPDHLQLQQDRDIYVTTSYGQVQGFKAYLYDNPDPESQYRPGSTPVERIMRNVSVFLGIPYALPPVDLGRFKPPRPHKGWQLIQAVDFGPACPQPVQFTGVAEGVRDMDEDCLYLNIYSPFTGSGIAQKYAVMFYIHGGEFSKGASNLFPGHVLASFYNVVVVTINYRLGALGFLSTADENSPGNYGILDQAMALQWVYDNIEFFNGDKHSITLFGPGAGAASAGLLMVAPKTRHMVNKVIAQSGSALADWAVIRDKYRAQNTSRVFGKHLGCNIDTSWKLVSCLNHGRSFYEIGNADFIPEVGTFPWAPVLDKNFTVPGDSWYQGWFEKDWHFLTEDPEDSIKWGKYNPALKYMSGVTMQEAAFMIYNNQSLAPFYEVSESFFNQKVRQLVLGYNYTLNQEGVYQAIKYMYTYWPDPRNTTHIREQYIHMMSDFLYRGPSDKMSKLLLEKRIPLYLYVLNTTVEAFRYPEWRKVPHDIEHYWLSGAPFMDVEFFPPKLGFERNMWTEADRNMSHFFMKAYSDFAKFGNPSQQQILGLHFEMAIPGTLKYLNINTTFNSSIMYNYRQTESAFWSYYLPTVIGMLVPTYPPSTEFWFEPGEPLQIAFWSVTGLCLLLIVGLVICCILWRNAKRNADRYYGGELININDDFNEGIDNTSRSTNYEFRETPVITKRAPVGTPPPGFKSRQPSLMSKSQQNIIELPGEKPLKASKSSGNFVNMHPNPNLKTYSVPSLRGGSSSRGSKESITESDIDRRRGIRKDSLRSVPQTAV